MGNRRGARPGSREKLIAQVAKLNLPCGICGDPINYDIEDYTHPEHYELDELIPYSKGGSTDTWENTQPAHRICNLLKGNKEGFYLNGLFDAYTKYKGTRYKDYQALYLSHASQNEQKEVKVTFFGSKIA